MIKTILQEVREHIVEVIEQKSDYSRSLWKEFLAIHPVDIAHFFEDIDREDFQLLYMNLPRDLRLEVFQSLTDSMRVYSLSFMSEPDKIDALNLLGSDELTDLFEFFSDEELKKHLSLLHRKARQKVLSLLKFPPESAGGIMDTEAFSLLDDFTVEKSIQLLQRLKPRLEIHRQIYVTDRANRLVGHINLEDLVLQNPKNRIASFIRKNELIAHVEEDREAIANKMVHYGLMTVPVIDGEDHFLGIIPSDTLVDVIVEEASEDVQKMAALTPLKYPYFETSFFRLLYERSYILIALLLAESFSGTIMRAYEATLGIFLLSFVPMLISAGGNTSSQTSAMVIQGIASGDIRRANMFKFIRREFSMALMLGGILGLTAFARVWYTSGSILQSFIVSFSLGLIVLTSVILGSCIPFILRRFNVDPAFSAGPFLATLMDILGIFIYCYVTGLFLR